MIDLKDKKVGVLGLGDENVALVKYLVKTGAKVVVCDRKKREELGDYFKKISNLPIQFRLGAHYLDHLEDFELVFRTPGLPYLTLEIQEAETKGVEISSETRLFFNLCPCPIIGVTGTKGKGTTASLISKILEKKFEARSTKLETNFKIKNSKNKNISDLKPKVFLGGNIGKPPIEFLDKLKVNDIVILELSSFQLQDLDCSPHIAVVLAIFPDHLDYHKNEDEYLQAKSNIVKYQKKTDFAVINSDYENCVRFKDLTLAQVFWFSRYKKINQGIWVRDKKEFILNLSGRVQKIADTKDLQLRGEHNFENISAAIMASKLAGADVLSIQQIIKNFKGLEHRLECVRELHGVKYYNDSFSTTPETTMAAIKSFKEPIILFLGGSEKNADYQKLAATIEKSSVKIIINVGLTGQRIIKLIKNPEKIEIVNKITPIEEAVNFAQKKSKKGDVVLMSPASASFDSFKNYKERGERFKKAVLNLK